MQRMIFLVLVMALVFGTTPPAARAQGQPPGAPPGTPVAQGQQRQGNPVDAQRANHRPGSSSMPPEMMNLPYNGPGAVQLPPNIRTREDIENPANRRVLEAAAAEARPRQEAARRVQDRVARGERTPPTQAEHQAMYGNGTPVQPPPQPPAPRPRSDNPVYNLLGFISALPDSHFLSAPGTAPDPTPEAAPDAQAYGTCNNYAWLWDSYDYQWGAQFFYAEGLQICGVVNVSDIKSMHMGTALFKCSWYFSWFNYCMAPQHYDELLPVDSQGAGSNVQWGRLKTYYPWVSGAYYLKIYTYVEYWQGGWTNNQADSAGFVTFNCPGYGCS